MKWMLSIVLALVAGCSSKGESKEAGGGVATFALLAPGMKPEEAVNVTATVPKSWKTTIEQDGSPEFELPGDTSFMKPTLVLLEPAGADDAERMTKTIGLQYSAEDLAKAKREELSGGRVWIEHVQDNGYVHARLFVPAPKQEGVVMCVAMLKSAAKLPEIRKMCETVAIGG